MANQENIILPCSSCQAKYNVTNLRAGTKFKCTKCGTINVVPVQENAPTVFMPRQQVPQATKRLTPVMRQPSTVTRQSSVTRPSALERGVTAGKFTRQQGTEPSDDIDKKKKKKTWMIVGVVGGVVLLIIIIIVLSSGGKSEEEKMIEEANKKAAEKESDKFSQTDKETPKETEKTPEPEPKKVEEKKPPKETKPSKPKLEIDETVKTEVVPLVKDMRNQKDEEQKSTREKIIGKGKKAIPVLIEIIGGEDEWAAMNAYEILIKMTKRNRDDTTKVNQMLSRDMRKDCQKDWEEWWLKNKDNLTDLENKKQNIISDYWYEMTVQGQKVGYVNDRIEQTKYEGKDCYKFTSESFMQMTGNDGTVSKEKELSTAYTDLDFSPLYLKREKQGADGQQQTTEITIADSKINIKTDSEQKYIDFEKGIIFDVNGLLLKQKGLLKEKSKSSFKYISLETKKLGTQTIEVVRREKVKIQDTEYLSYLVRLKDSEISAKIIDMNFDENGYMLKGEMRDDNVTIQFIRTTEANAKKF